MQYMQYVQYVQYMQIVQYMQHMQVQHMPGSSPPWHACKGRVLPCFLYMSRGDTVLHVLAATISPSVLTERP